MTNEKPTDSDVQLAENWFERNGIHAYQTANGRLMISIPCSGADRHDFDVELSDSEILRRAELESEKK